MSNRNNAADAMTWHEDGRSDTPLAKFLSSLPSEEQKDAALLLGNVMRLTFFVNDFGSATQIISWMEQFEEQKTAPAKHLHSCKEVAARDAVLSIYHIGISLSSILSACKTLSCFQHCVPKLKHVLKDFDQIASNQVRSAMRDAVGHRAERTKSISHFKAHASKAGQQIIGRLRGRTYEITGKNEQRALSIDADMHRQLSALMLRVLALFPMLKATGERRRPSARGEQRKAIR